MRVRIFGLQGNGTNFIEWTIKHNFDKILYSKEIAKRNVEGDVQFGRRLNLKHCYPTNESDYFNIIIKRDFEDWAKSKKFSSNKYNREIYDYYYDTPYREEWPDSDFILINHKWAVENYYELLTLISDKTKCSIRTNWKQPEYRMKMDNGQTMSNEKYEY